jgi:hypothetical protein
MDVVYGMRASADLESKRRARSKHAAPRSSV